MMLSSIPLLGTILDVFDKVIPDRDIREKMKSRLLQMETRGELDLMKAQLRVNAQEAAHKSIFVAGWRPFVGWICAVGMLHHFLLADFITAIWPSYASSGEDLMVHVLTGMLGLSGMRSYEKLKGIARGR